jgi:hypothetical protein
VQPGYKLGEKVIRHAKVAVGQWQLKTENSPSEGKL